MRLNKFKTALLTVAFGLAANAAIIQYDAGPTGTGATGDVLFSPLNGEVSTTITDASLFGVSNAFGELALAYNLVAEGSFVVSPNIADPTILSVARLASGKLIGPKAVFDNTEFILADSMGVLGNWNAHGRDYFGFLLQTDKGTHYGWADITVHPDLNVTLHSFAYETVAGRGIIAGSVSSVPEPSTIAMLALGLGVILVARRKRKSQTVTAVAILALAAASGAHAQTAGEEDPIGKRLMQFRSDYYWSAIPPSDKGYDTERMWAPVFGDNPYSVGLELPLHLSYGFDAGRQHSSISGRFLTPNNDHAVKVFADNNGSLYANFFNTPNGASDFNFASPGPLPRFARSMPDGTTFPTTDFVAAAAGDLDRHVDTSGNFHDEIAIAYVGTDNKIYLVVLDYSNTLMDDSGNISIVEPTMTRIDTGLTFDPTLMAGAEGPDDTNPQSKIFPFDNILSVAVGDFDGDQSGEIALAVAVGPQNLTVQTWRYRWGSPSRLGMIGTQTVTPIQQYGSSEFTLAQGSLTANVTLAAGDFYGTGVDQLALGFQQWRKDEFNALLSITVGKWGVAPRFVVNVLSASQQNNSVNVTASPGYPTFLTLDDPSVLPLIPQRITISNAPSSWNVLNGTWDVFVTADNKLQIALDSTAIPTNLNGQIQISVSNPLALPPSAQPMVIDPKNYQGLPLQTSVFDYNLQFAPRIQLLSGLFKFDGDNFTFSRRQLAAVFTMPQFCNMQDGPNTPVECQTDVITQQTWAIVTNFYTVNSDNLGAAQFSIDNGVLINAPPQANQPFSRDFGWGQQWTATAGAFRGLSTIGSDGTSLKPPTWQVALTVPYNSDIVNTYIQELSNGNVNSAIAESVTLNSHDQQMRPGLVNFDPVGNSLFLGAPVKLSSSQMYTPLTILQEPPKHLAWIKGAMVPVNRGDGFAVQLTTSTGVAMTTDTQTTHDSTFTQTHTVSAGGSVKLNFIPGLKDTTTLQDTAKFQFDKSEHEEDYKKGSSSDTYSDTAVTNHDDYIRAQTQDLNIWRYRVYGAKGASGNNVFYDLTFPGPMMKAPGAGNPVDWYHPTHENGNALSYPPLPASGLPDDVNTSAYTVAGLTPPSVTNGVMYSGDGFCLGGTTSSPTVTLTGVTDASQKIGTSKSNSWDNDTKVSTDFKIGIFGGNASYEGDFGQKQSWSSTSSSDNQLSGSTTITYNVDSADDSNNYRTFPVFYNSNAGVLKFVHYVQIPTTGESSLCDSGANFWTDAYGGAPDPALNLPNRFNWVSYNKSNDTTTWELNPKITREKMKGFFVQSPTASALETDVYPPLSYNPQVGSTVRLAARVYNYSVGNNPINNVTVTFYAEAYDDNHDNEIGCGVPVAPTTGQVCAPSTRILLGSTTVASIPSWGAGQQNWVEAGYNWAIPSNFITANGTDAFRIYVQLKVDPSQIELNPPQVPCVGDPATPLVCKDMVTDSTQPGWDATKPGQNNEGWGLIVLSPASTTASAAGSVTLTGVTDQMTPIVRRSLKTVPDSLAGIDAAGQVRTGLMTVYLNSNVKFRVKGVGEMTAFTNEHHALVFDGTGKDRKMIAGVTLRGARTTGTHGWFEWRAESLGLHQLTLVLPEPQDDPKKGDNTATLRVLVVRKPGDLNADGVVNALDSAILEKEIGQRAKTSACGTDCDLDGDGVIGKGDLLRLTGMCDRDFCAVDNSRSEFRKTAKK